jgi:hypothetical protein
LPKAVEG